MTQEMEKRYNNGKPSGLFKRIAVFLALVMSMIFLFAVTIAGFFVKGAVKTFSRGGK